MSQGRELAPRCCIGIDIGTTKVKAAAIDEDGRVVAVRSAPTPTQYPRPGWAEHDPEALWRTVASLVGKLVATLGGAEIGAVAATGVGEAGVPVAEDGGTLRPIIAWFDRRAEQQATSWEKELGSTRIREISGQLLDAYCGVNKLLWVRDNQPETFAATQCWLGLADLVLHRLSGERATDRSLASRVMLLDQRTLTWSDELLAAAGLNRMLLPEVVGAGTPVGRVVPEAARACGLPESALVVAAGHDHLCGAFVARGGEDDAIDSCGSAEGLLLSLDRYLTGDSPETASLSSYADVVPGRWIASARVGLAGALLDWVRSSLFGGLSHAELEGEIPRPLRPSRILCYPAFGRAIAAQWEAEAPLGALLGITTAHQRGDIIQAFLEGTCYSLRANLEMLERATGRRFEPIRVEGGAVRNCTWLQLKADVLGRQVAAVDVEEPAAVGAALLAAVGVGWFSSHEEASSAAAGPIKIVDPDPGRSSTYADLYQNVYLGVPDRLAPLHRALRK